MRLEGNAPSSEASAQRWDGVGVGSTSVITMSDGHALAVGTVFVPVEYNPDGSAQWGFRSSYGWPVIYGLGSAPIYTKVDHDA